MNEQKIKMDRWAKRKLINKLKREISRNDLQTWKKGEAGTSIYIIDNANYWLDKSNDESLNGKTYVSEIQIRNAKNNILFKKKIDFIKEVESRIIIADELVSRQYQNLTEEYDHRKWLRSLDEESMLKHLLKEAIDVENYEEAARLRDELKEKFGS